MTQQQTDMRAEIRDSATSYMIQTDRDDICYSEQECAGMGVVEHIRYTLANRGECTVSIYHDSDDASDDAFDVIWTGTSTEYLSLMAED